MSNSDKNIVITPNVGQAGLPEIAFTGAGNTPVSLKVLDDGSLAFSNASGNIFVLTNASGNLDVVGNFSAANFTGSLSGTSSGTNTGDQTITLTGDVTGSGTGSFSTSIGANKVSNAMLAQVPESTFMGRATAGTGNVENLTVAQATSLIATFTTSLKGLVPPPSAVTGNFLKDDGTWAAVASDWGSIGGILSNQIDLQVALDAKLNSSSVSVWGLNFVSLTDSESARSELSLGSAALSDEADFANAIHTHVISDITGLSDALNSKYDSSNVSVYGGTLVASVDAAFARDVLALGTAALAASTDFAPAIHSHSIANITGLQNELDNKQPLDATLTALAGLTTTTGILEQTGSDTFTKRAIGVASASDLLTRDHGDLRFAALSHGHTISEIVDLQTTLDGKLNLADSALFAPASHAHAISNITGLQTALDGKQPIDATLTALAGLSSTVGVLEQTGVDTFTKRAIGAASDTDILSRLAADGRYAASAHTHAISDVTGLSTALSGKEPTISSGTTAQYWRGDKSWQALDKAAVGLGNIDNTSDANKPVSTAQQTALDLKANIANPTFTGTVTLAADPTNAFEAATKQYVDNVAQGIDIKASVLCATTANITLSGEQTIDGVLTASSRVLVKNQSSASQNGIYVTASSAWSRAADMNSYAEFPNAFVFVEQGTTLSDTGWVCTSNTGGTLGSTAITWTQFSGAGAFTASGGITQTGTTFSLTSMPANTLKGNNTGSTATPSDLTGSQVVAILPVFGVSTKGVVPSSGGGTTNFLRADGSWASPNDSSAVWGGITGDISNQLDLMNALAAKIDLSLLTAFSESIITAADAAEARTILGLGTAALSSTSSFAAAVHSHAISDITGLSSALSGKEPSITGGTISQFWRGDKSWQTLDKTAVGLGNVDNTSDANKPVSTAQQTALDLKEGAISAGTTAQYWRGDKSWQTLNKTAVGLGNVDNTSDANKPVSTAQQTALDLKADLAGAVFTGTVVAPQLNLGKTNFIQWGDGQNTIRVDDTPVWWNTYNNLMTLNSGSGAFTLRKSSNSTTVLRVSPDVFEYLGVTVYHAGNLTKTTLNLGNVDNTSDANKPVSTATQTALDLKEGTISAGTTAQYWRGDKSWQTLDKTVVGLSNVDNTSDANKPISTATSTALSGKEDSISAGTTAQYWRGDKSWQTLGKAAVGLSNVDNTSDANKPVSTATQTALDLKEGTISAGTTAQYWRGDKSWQTLDKAVVGLGNVDNTSDANKPVSTDQQIALNLKLDSSHAGTGGSAHAVVTAGGAAGFISGADKSKLDGIASGATANSSDAVLLARANHTGTQSHTTVTMASGKLLGRTGAGTGATEAISLGGGLVLSGGTLSLEYVDSSWPITTATGTGVPQDITLPSAGYAEQDVLVFVNGSRWNVSEYTITGDVLNLTSNAPGDVIEIIKPGSGATGPEGPAGVGVPAGGDIGQVLGKLSAADYDFTFLDVQPKDSTLTALAGLNTTPGVVEQTGADTFTKRAIGTSSSTDLLARADGDGRYSQIGHVHEIADITGLSSSLSAKQNLDATLTALAALNSTAGLLEQTGADTFTKRAIGISASSDILTRGDGDGRYAATSHSHTISNITGLQAALDAKLAASSVSTFALTLLDDVTASAMRATLELGTAAIAATADFATAVHTHSQSSITNLVSDLASKEPTISSGTTAQYWRGDKSWQILDKASVGLGNVDNTSDANKPVSTAQQTALDLKANLASPTFTGTVTLAADPTNPLEAATKQYVDNVAQGIDAKESVLVATTTNIILSGEQTIDGVLTASSRVLVKNQSVSSQNGIYISGSGSWTRASDLDSWAKLPGAFVFIEQGTAHGDSGWVCTVDVGGTLDSTAVTWTQFSGSGTYAASGGITLTGSTFSLSTMPAATLKGNNTGSSAAPADLSATQVTAMLNTFGAAKGLVPGVASSTNSFLRADSTWVSALTPASVAASGNVTGANLSGTNTGDQTITLTGDITGSGTGSFAATIGANKVTYDKFQQIASGVILGRVTTSTGNVESLSASAVRTLLAIDSVNNTSDADKPISTATQAALDLKEPTISAGTTAQYWRGDKSWQTLNKAVVGLGNVDNTSDANKPVSTATQTALDLKANKATDGTNGFFSEDTRAIDHLPNSRGAGVYADLKTNSTDLLSDGGSYHGIIHFKPNGGAADFTTGNPTQMAFTQNNNVWVRTGNSTTTWGAWSKLLSTTNATKSDVGLGNVDNTSDANKPISTATQTALDLKEGTISAGTTAQYWRGDKSWQTLNKAAVGLGNIDNTSDINKPVSTAQQTALDLKADLASPALTGTATFVNATGSGTLAFGSAFRQMVGLYSDTYGIGVQTNTLYLRTANRLSIYTGGVHSDSANAPGVGGTNIFEVTASQAIFSGALEASNFSGSSSGINTGDQTTVSGNAGTATALQTARTIGISGPATGTATSFNGTANITIPITAIDLTHANVSGPLPTTKGGTGTTSSTGSGSLVLATSPTLDGTVTVSRLRPVGVSDNSSIPVSDGYDWGYQQSGAWTAPYPDLIIGYSTGIKIGANISYGGVKFYADHPDNGTAPAELFSVGNGDNHVRVANNLITSGTISATGTISASNFSGSSSGTNTGDQTRASLALATTNDVTFRDLYASRGDGTGYLYLNGATATRYLSYDGTKYNLPSAQLNVNGSQVWHAGNLNTADFAAASHTHSGVYEPAFTTLPVNKGGTGVTTSTGTGNVVLSVSPTFTGTAAFAGLTTSSTIVSTGSISTSGSFLAPSTDAASAPGFTWSGDTDTGMFRSATNTLGLATSGVSRFTLSTTTAAFTVAVTSTGNITAYSSDARLKKNVSPISSALDKLRSIGGYSFDWDINLCHSIGFVPENEHEHGLLAQEIQKVLPDVVVPAAFDPEYFTVRYERVMPLVVEATKELDRKVQEQAKMIEDQQIEIEELKAKIALILSHINLD